MKKAEANKFKFEEKNSQRKCPHERRITLFFNNCSMKKLIGLENLPNNFKVYLDDKFRKELFNKVEEKYKNKIIIRSVLGYNSDICSLIRGHRQNKKKKSIRFLKVKTLKILSKIMGVPIGEIEKHIIGIKSKGIILKTKFPILATKELASLVGHCFGDGHVSSRKCYYYNTSLELMKEYQNNIKAIFRSDLKINTIENEWREIYRMLIPINIGRLLILAGAPNGRKTTQELKIPYWVLNGTKEIKASFIGALYDDEGCVSFRKGGKNSIIFGMATKANTKYLSEFLNSFRKILLDLGIESNEINKEKPVYKFCNNSNRIVLQRIGLQFTITGFKNFEIFLQKINLIHLSKKQKLEKILGSYKEFHYRHGEREKIILEELSKHSYTIQDLVKKIDRTDEPIRLSLHRLKNKGLVETAGLHPVVWRLKN